MENIDNIDLNGIDIDTSDIQQEAKPVEENPYEGKRLSWKKLLGWGLGIGVIAGGIVCIVNHKNEEE